MLPILTYHSLDTSGSVISVSPYRFTEQMASLAALGFRGIALREAVAYRDAHGEWPETCAVLTFDDGYANFADEALPVLRSHGFTATVFLVDGHVSGDNDWASPPSGLGIQPLLSWEQVAAVANAGMEIGSHTRTHPDLFTLTGEDAEDEIVSSREAIEKCLGISVVSFAYPFGHVSPVAREIVQRTFRSACTTVLKRVGNEPLHSLPRIDMYYMQSHRLFERLLHGQLDRYLTIRRWGRALRRLSTVGMG